MNRMFHPTGPRGLTLIELMLVLAVLAVLVTLAAPSMSTLIHSNQIRTQTSRLMTAINLARSEAISRNSPVSLCPSALVLSGQPVCSGTYADGWIVFSNRDKDRVVDAGIDEVIRAFEGLPVGYTLTNKLGTIAATELINYLPDGSSRRNRTLMLCASSDASIPSWSVILNIVGRPRMEKGWGQCLPS